MQSYKQPEADINVQCTAAFSAVRWMDEFANIIWAWNRTKCYIEILCVPSDFFAVVTVAVAVVIATKTARETSYRVRFLLLCLN